MLLRMVRGNGRYVWVEVSESASPSVGAHKAGAVGKMFASVNEVFDKVVQNEIVENCTMLAGAFEELRSQSSPPTKATVEFGLELSGEGNIYLVKSAVAASIKVSVEWNFEAVPAAKT